MSEPAKTPTPAGRAATKKELPEHFKGYKHVWVFIEQERGQVHPVSWELLGAGRQLADKLKAETGIDCEVIDVRSLVPLDTQTILGSVGRTHRLFTVEENPRLCGWGAEIVSIVADEAFYDLDGPPVRITTPHIPLPAADHLEDLALPNAARIVDKIVRVMNG